MSSENSQRDLDLADRHVGSRIRLRRLTLGLTQQQLADKVGITFQQVHKYEAGINRIRAGRLYELAGEMGVRTGWFFEGLEGETDADEPSVDPLTVLLAENPDIRMAVASLLKIEDPKLRQQLIRVIRTLAESCCSPRTDRGSH